MRKTIIPKSSFLYRFIIRFILMVIVPVLFSWMAYTMVIHYYYSDNTLSTQQINMENSLSSLDSSLDSVSNAITALEGNTEIVYYLEYYSSKPEMLYSLKKNIRSFCDNLCRMNTYLETIKIYSDNPTLLYADPFEKLENIPLDDTAIKELENSKVQEIIWSVSNSETTDFPSIYGYRKLYYANYSKCMGYVEVQLSPKLFEDYFSLLMNLSDDPHAVLTLYQETTLIYSTSPDAAISDFKEETKNNYQMDILSNQYINHLEIPQLKLCVTRSGQLSNRLLQPSFNILSIFLTVIIALLLILFIVFFINVASLSKRILDFSSFIKHSDPNNLVAFHPETNATSREDELDSLISTYNSMIQENSSLISQVQKMELLSKDARYQALQGQIHPHFIYGTLETIRMMALQNQDNEAADMIFSLSALIRYSISISSKSVSLKDELEIASHYLKIQKIRFGDRMDYAFSVDESLLNMELPSFILQPILENAIVYGIAHTLDHSMLTIDIHKKESSIILTFTNTGLPITRQRLEEVNALLSGKIVPVSFSGKHNGLALNNIRERLSIFFNGNASIRLEQQDDHTATIITLPSERKQAYASNSNC